MIADNRLAHDVLTGVPISTKDNYLTHVLLLCYDDVILSPDEWVSGNPADFG